MSQVHQSRRHARNAAAVHVYSDPEHRPRVVFGSVVLGVSGHVKRPQEAEEVQLSDVVVFVDDNGKEIVLHNEYAPKEPAPK